MADWEEVLDELQQTRLREVFDHLDTDGDGQISVDDLKKAIASSGFDIDSDVAGEVVARCDTDGTGSVSWENFCAGVIILGVTIVIVLYLRMLFDKIDADNTGFITLPQLQEIAKTSGVDPEYVDSSQVKALFSKMDEAGDGKVDFKEFLVGLVQVVQEKVAAAQ